MSNDEQRAASDPVGARVAAAARALRANARLTLAEVAEKMAEVGWPLSVASLLRLEQHKRRIEVGDLDAMSRVFRVDPTQLLAGRVDVTVSGSVNATLPQFTAQIAAEQQQTATHAAIQENAQHVRGAVVPGGSGITSDVVRAALSDPEVIDAVVEVVRVRLVEATGSATHPDPRTMTPEERAHLRAGGVDILPDEELDS